MKIVEYCVFLDVNLLDLYVSENMFVPEDEGENSDEVSNGIQDLDIRNGANQDDYLPPLLRLERYAMSDNMYNRQMVGRVALETLRAVADTPEDIRAAMDIINRAAFDTEMSVRVELMEQLPHIAMVCHEERDRLLFVVQDYLLPLVIRLLGDSDNQVRKTTQAALLVLMEQGLVEMRDVEQQVCPVILTLTEVDNLVEFHTGAVALMSKMAPLLGSEATERLFMRRFASLCADPVFYVRKVCANTFGDFCGVVGTAATEECLLPYFVELCSDGIWGVRKACAEVFTTVALHCTLQTRKETLAPVFNNLLLDQSRWVRMSAFQALGQFIATFANSCSSSVPHNEYGEFLFHHNEDSRFQTLSSASTNCHVSRSTSGEGATSVLNSQSFHFSKGTLPIVRDGNHGGLSSMSCYICCMQTARISSIENVNNVPLLSGSCCESSTGMEKTDLHISNERCANSVHTCNVSARNDGHRDSSLSDVSTSVEYDNTCQNFNTFQYWRVPIPELELSNSVDEDNTLIVLSRKKTSDVCRSSCSQLQSSINSTINLELDNLTSRLEQGFLMDNREIESVDVCASNALRCTEKQDLEHIQNATIHFPETRLHLTEGNLVIGSKPFGSQDDEEQSAVHDEPIIPHEEPGTLHDKPSTVQEESIASHKEPNASQQELSISHNEPSTSQKEPSTSPEEHSTSKEEPSTSHEEPSSAHEEPSSAHEEPSSAHEEPSSAHEEPSSALEEPSSALEEPSSAHEETNTSPRDSSTVHNELGTSEDVLFQEDNIISHEDSSILHGESGILNVNKNTSHNEPNSSDTELNVHCESDSFYSEEKLSMSYCEEKSNLSHPEKDLSSVTPEQTLSTFYRETKPFRFILPVLRATTNQGQRPTLHQEQRLSVSYQGQKTSSPYQMQRPASYQEHRPSMFFQQQRPVSYLEQRPISLFEKYFGDEQESSVLYHEEEHSAPYAVVNHLIQSDVPSNRPLQDIVPHYLVEHFVSMTYPSQAQNTDNEITHHCAFSIPAVVLTLGRDNWQLIKPAYEALASDVQWKVRRTVAASIHELAVILGDELAGSDLVPVFHGFIKDLDEVRIGALRHLADFLKLLRPAERNTLLHRLSDFHLTDNDCNWRFRNELAEQLFHSLVLFTPADTHEHITPLSISLLMDKVAAVRKKALSLVTQLVRHVSSEINLVRNLLAELAERFAHNKHWCRRQTFALLCSQLTSQHVLKDEHFACDVFPHLLDLSLDRVPNVRLSVAQTLACDVAVQSFFSRSESPHNEVLIQCLRRLQIDDDKDVRYFASLYSLHALTTTSEFPSDGVQ